MIDNRERVARHIRAEGRRRRRIQGAPFKSFEREDELTPAEAREAGAIFARARHSGASLDELRERALGRAARASGNATSPGHSRTRTPATVWDRPSPSPPLHSPVSAGELAVMAGVTLGAFFVGRWWARRRHRARMSAAPPPTKVSGYLVGVDLLGSLR